MGRVGEGGARRRWREKGRRIKERSKWLEGCELEISSIGIKLYQTERGEGGGGQGQAGVGRGRQPGSVEHS